MCFQHVPRAMILERIKATNLWCRHASAFQMQSGRPWCMLGGSVGWGQAVIRSSLGRCKPQSSLDYTGPQPLTQTGPRSRTRQTDCPQGKLAVGPHLWADFAALNSPDRSYLLHWSRSQLHLHSFQPGPPHAQRRCICMSHTQMHLHWEMNSDIRPAIGKRGLHDHGTARLPDCRRC